MQKKAACYKSWLGPMSSLSHLSQRGPLVVRRQPNLSRVPECKLTNGPAEVFPDPVWKV